MGFTIVLIVVGISMVLWPTLFSSMSRREHALRLSKLRAGEREAFFEEKRSLETYPPARDGLAWRKVLGAGMIATALGLLIFVYRPQWQAENERKASLVEARAAVTASRVAVTAAQSAVSQATVGGQGDYQKANAAVDRAEAALARSERAGN